MQKEGIHICVLVLSIIVLLGCRNGGSNDSILQSNTTSIVDYNSRFIYTVDSINNRVLLHTINPQDGSLSTSGAAASCLKPKDITMHPDMRHLYVTCASSVASYEIASNGELTNYAESPKLPTDLGF